VFILSFKKLFILKSVEIKDPMNTSSKCLNSMLFSLKSVYNDYTIV